MPDEANVQEEVRWLYEHKARRVVKNLTRRNINAQYCTDRKEALKKVMELIPEGATVGWGDSVTLRQIGVISELRRRNSNHFYDPRLRDADGHLLISAAESDELRRKSLLADVFLAGTNAITLDGKLVNIDSHGNRVAGMLFGPKKVIIVVGVNKIVKDVDEAIKRIKEVAAPLNSKRHYNRHHVERYADLPCVKLGVCTECEHPWKPCRKTVIIEGEHPTEVDRMHVIIVGEELGL